MATICVVLQSGLKILDRTGHIGFNFRTHPGKNVFHARK